MQRIDSFWWMAAPAALALALATATPVAAQEAGDDGAVIGGDVVEGGDEPVEIDVPVGDGEAASGEDPVGGDCGGCEVEITAVEGDPSEDGGEPVDVPVLDDEAPGEDPVGGDCGGCEVEITSGGAEGGLPGLRRGRDDDRYAAPELPWEQRPNLCTSAETYVGWLCAWQGFERP